MVPALRPADGHGPRRGRLALTAEKLKAENRAAEPGGPVRRRDPGGELCPLGGAQEVLLVVLAGGVCQLGVHAVLLGLGGCRVLSAMAGKLRATDTRHHVI